jgi:hypothetical protein
MRTLDENRKEQNECREKVYVYQKRVVELENEEAEIRYSADFPIGKRVFIDKKEYEVYRYYDQCHILARKIKKDGGLSQITQCLYSSDLKNATDENGNKILKQGNEL